MAPSVPQASGPRIAPWQGTGPTCNAGCKQQMLASSPACPQVPHTALCASPCLLMHGRCPVCKPAAPGFLALADRNAGQAPGWRPLQQLSEKPARQQAQYPWQGTQI